MFGVRYNHHFRYSQFLCQVGDETQQRTPNPEYRIRRLCLRIELAPRYRKSSASADANSPLIAPLAARLG